MMRNTLPPLASNDLFGIPIQKLADPAAKGSKRDKEYDENHREILNKYPRPKPSPRKCPVANQPFAEIPEQHRNDKQRPVPESLRFKFPTNQGEDRYDYSHKHRDG